jgi:hypothetical protein
MDSPAAASGAAQHPIHQILASLRRAQSTPPEPAGVRLRQRVEAGLQRLEQVLLATSDRSQRFSGMASVLCATAVASALLWVGAYPLRATGHDLLLPLDAAWRVLSGQVPHNDFYSPLGPAFAYWFALWMKLLGKSGDVVHHAVLAHALVVAPAAWYIGRRRFTALTNWLFCSLALLLCVAPFPVGWPPEALDTAMAYNRLAFGIVLVLAVEAALPARTPASSAWLEVSLMGLLFGILPMLKLNFALVGAGTQLLVLLQPRRDLPLRERVQFFGYGLAVPLCLFLALGVSPRAFVADMLMVLRVHEQAAEQPLSAMLTLASKLAPELWGQVAAPALAALLICAVGVGSRRERGLSVARLGALFVFLLLADLALGVSNTQLPTLVLLPLVALFAFEAVRHGIPHAPQSARGEPHSSRNLALRAATLASLLLSLAIWSGSGSEYLRGIGEAMAFKRQPQALDNTLVGQGFAKSVPFIPSNRYPRAQRAGFELLKGQLRPGDQLVTLDFSNPFNFTLGLVPARGDALWWHEDKTFTRSIFPAPERVFQDASLVIVARRWSQSLMPVYGAFLQQRYLPVAKDAYWVLFRRVSSNLPNTP